MTATQQSNDELDEHRRPPPDVDAMFQMIFNTAPWVFQSLYVAAKLALPDHLTGGARSSADLAAATGSDPDALYRFCRALAALEVLTELPGRVFELTPKGAALRSDAPGGMAAFMVVNGEESFRAWGEVMYSVRTGKPAFDQMYGMSHFDFLARNAASGRAFHRMSGRGAAPRVVESCSFTDGEVIVDVGGGSGGLLAQVLPKYPSARGVLQDLPVAADPAREFLEAQGLADRVEIVAQSFFEAVPSGGDTYILSRVVHDWNDEDALRLLGRVREAMKPTSRLLVIDQVLPEVAGFHPGKFSDLQMLVVLGGRERTVEELRTLLEQAGLELTNVLMPTPPPGSPRAEAVVEAVTTKQFDRSEP